MNIYQPLGKKSIAKFLKVFLAVSRLENAVVAQNSRGGNVAAVYLIVLLKNLGLWCRSPWVPRNICS